jgi:folate-binding protein YgfZ
MFHQILINRTLIALSGDDVIPFLQGIITQDALLLAKKIPLYSALLSPQGKFLHDFLLIPQEGRILLDIDSARADDLLSKFKVYKLRSRVEMEKLPDSSVIAVWGGDAGGIVDPRLLELGQRLYGVSAPECPVGDYEAHRIALCVPDGAVDMTPEKSLLLEFGFEALHGVSFSKGCYVGQETTARSKYRANIRKHLFAVHAKSLLPAKGSPVTHTDKLAGELLSVHGSQGLALLNMELVEQAQGVLYSEALELRAEFPKWLLEPPKKGE